MSLDMRKNTRHKRIGIFGGTFDPVHVGHLIAAVNAKAGAALDLVLLVVANIPWQKEGTRNLSDANTRFALVEAAVDGVEGLEASNCEIVRGGPSYTIDTVTDIGLKYPGAELFLIVGADAAKEIESWERSETLAELVTLVIVNRPGSWVGRSEVARWQTLFVEVPAIDISSTDIRARVREKRPLDYILTKETISYIRASGLYLDEHYNP